MSMHLTGATSIGGYRRTAVRIYFPIISNNYTKPYRNCQIFVLIRGDEVILLFQNFIQHL